ncbi:MAG: DUF4340 domain-containing protein [Clostridia bacterium]|nr:DUF4340 domain-containing protein [Clostridia bacterium]
MDKKLRNLLILGGILVLLCVGYAVAGLVFPDETPEETEAVQTDTTMALFPVTEDGLTALSFTYDKDGDGVAELWSYTRNTADDTWSWTEDGSVPLSSSAFYGYSSTLAGVTSIKTLTGVTAEQLAEYGLTEPAKTITFTDRVVGTYTFCIGAYNAYNGTYCAYRNGDTSTVYLVEGDFYSEFERSTESLVYHDDLPSFKADELVSLTMTQGDRTVVVTRTVSESVQTVWMRSVNGASATPIADGLGDSLELLVGDMDYLTCYGLKTSDFEAYGLHENTIQMTVVYRKTVSSVEEEKTFTLTLGGTDKYGYYYCNPKDTTLTMLLGGSVFSKVMTYDDEKLSLGDETTAS